MAMEVVEQRAQALLKDTADNSQPLSTMIPAPGMPHDGSTNSLVSYSAENSIISTSGAGLVAPTTVNMVDFRPDADGLAEYTASFSACDGLASNGFQQLPNNIALGSTGNDIMSSMRIKREQSQMIPTPGLNNLQQVSMNHEFSDGGGLFSAASTMVSLQQQSQQKQYIGTQNNRMLHSPRGHVGSGMSSNMQHKASAYEFANGVINGGLGLFGNGMQLVNGPIGSEVNTCTAPYGDNNSMSMVDLSGSENFYGLASSVAPTMSNHNLNHTSLLPKTRTNAGLLTHYARLHSMQQIPTMMPQMSDHSHNMNCQPAHSSQERMMQAQHQMRNFHLQQLKQQPIQSSQFTQQQHHHQQQQQSMQQQQLIPMADSMRQSLMTSNVGGQLISELAIDSHNDLFIPHAAEQLHLSEIESHSLQNTSNSDCSKGAQSLGCASGLQEFQPLFSQHPYQQVTESQNDFSHLANGLHPNTSLQGDLHQSIPRAHVPHKLPFQQQVQEEFHLRMTGKDEAQQPHISLEQRIPLHAAARRIPQSSTGVSSAPGNYTREQDYLKQTRWLLLLLHARGCPAPKGTCKEVNCVTVQKLCTHMERCNLSACGFPRCYESKKLFNHYRACRAATCPVCIPVRKYIDHMTHNRSDSGLPAAIHEPLRSTNAADGNKMISNVGASSIEVHEDTQCLPKRLKLQHDLPAFVPKKETSPVYVHTINQSHASQEPQPVECGKSNVTTHAKSEVIEVETDISQGNGHEHPHPAPNRTNDDLDNAHVVRADAEPLHQDEIKVRAKQEIMVVENESEQTKMEVKHEANALPIDPASGSKSGKPKIKGVSLTELFTPEQVRDHIVGLRQWVGQSKAKAEKNQAMERSMNENSCQLCAVEKLTFDPPPIYCTPCGARIKRNAMYYTMGSGDTRHYFCIPCYNEARGDTIEVEGSAFPKARLEKKKNDEETEEWWVQCDKCEAWQHQICALFNGRRNDGDQAEYTCPNCYTKEVHRGERKPLPQSAVLGAKDLPRTMLSDHIEERLFRQLKQEREERARHLGKPFDEVPGAEGLVVRVVSSVDKKLEVKQRFLEIFQEDNYPTEFPYKSKVILLFQKIEGVEVCLFGMYLQEFGSECQFPNQRRVYLSYLDSVKYFRPEIKTVTGEALRTFVYHEILIGYLDYCKKRGFTSCYIWACPPLKGEDYILYCHPEIQKTPKSDKLREWYLSMLRKAAKENIVVDLTNLYDHFFIKNGECKAKVTAARLPYFDGDYWPGAAEDMINQLQQEEDGKKLQKKGKTKKILTKRALKAAGHADLSGNASKDALLMQKLGETICPMKEDFIMVHLQRACTHCCLLMVSGKLWVCKQCKNFQLCDNCHIAEQRLDDRDRHPIYGRDKHMLYPVEINDVPSDTKDRDEILESEFFDTRQAFLSLCQGNHYQYDTLRRAKHSSMMVLYHLHNPTAPAFVTTCNVCHHDIETGQGWRCEICPDFDICHACYQKNVGVDHPHKLTNHPSMAERDAQNKEARQKRVLQLRKMLDLLVHASQCRNPHCQYPNCRKVKGLFRHGFQCKIRASGGCTLCKKMWYLLQLHARACKESGCHVPRCKDLREHLKRMQQQSESRRRAAVMEMMRQRAAEVAGNGE